MENLHRYKRSLKWLYDVSLAPQQQMAEAHVCANGLKGPAVMILCAQSGCEEAYMAVSARLIELRGRDCPVLKQQMADAHVAHVVVLRLQRQVFKEASDHSQPAYKSHLSTNC